MTTEWATLDTASGKAVLTFTRHLDQPVEKVWRAITDPDHLERWFPARVSDALTPGEPLRFTMDGEDAGTGHVIVFDQLRVFAFSWDGDVLRFELIEHPHGCTLTLIHTINAAHGGVRAAARNAAGWDTCLDALVTIANGEQPAPAGEMLTVIESYIERFGLGYGTVTESADGHSSTIVFDRDLVWRPIESAWELLTGAQNITEGDIAPARAVCHDLTPGRVIAATAPLILELDCPGADTVRWKFTAEADEGHRVILTHMVHDTRLLPDLLAAWHIHLDHFFTELLDGTQNSRDAQAGKLREEYTARLAGATISR
ncbi:SRPBCC family protein [Hoyosella sp. YIM 151337]|uniref:SRPBCC family protein n=1 Tax=Hoyosella sp. YIM 151337 TaxID=2992742 RepID=UPI002236A815|nr:SRPBCC family protein [Hoyosella sp. YIM 151337]MCW4354093.1 SRPBCC family protein [Hoyosella sp. YIM 151337]